MHNRTHVIFCTLLMLGVAGCSKEDPDTAAATGPVTPSLEQNGAANERTEDVVMAAETAAGGIPTSYRAYFTGGNFMRIAEVRTAAGGESAHGEYEFHGARLLKYTGRSLSDATPLDLELDLQGRVLVARAAARDASREEISAIRERAQLLRSHALAHRASRTHVTN